MSCELLKKMIGVKSTEKKDHSNLILEAIKSTNDHVIGYVNDSKNSLSKSDMDKILSDKLDFLTTKYIERITFKVSNSISQGFDFSHIFFLRKDFQGWHTFVHGGYSEASPKKCADLFMNHIKSKDLVPKDFECDCSDFSNKTNPSMSKGHNSIKISWDKKNLNKIVNIPNLTVQDPQNIENNDYEYDENDIIDDDSIAKKNDIIDDDVIAKKNDIIELDSSKSNLTWFHNNLYSIEQKIVENIKIIDGKVHVVFNFGTEVSNIVNKKE